jgi:hypothetical protein
MTVKSDNYLGNRNLKKTYVPVEWTTDLVKEYVKCSKDPVYFITEYVKIVHVDFGVIPLKLYDFQKDIVRKSFDNRFLICKMPRQVGKTTTIAAIILHHILFNENYSVAILAHKAEQAREILGRIQLAYEALPKWLQQGIIKWNEGSVELENGSKITASSTASSAIRGTSQNLVYLDEFAFVPGHIQQEFFASVYPTISSGTTTKVIITSTPKGLNLFYKLWKDSEEGRNSYSRVDVHWSQVPGRDEKWKQETIRNTSEEQFREEFECEFLGSSSTLISGLKLRMLTHSEPIKSDEHLKVYKEPEKDRVYFIAVDTARGREGDYSAFKIFDATELPYRDVASYRNNSIDPVVYPSVIFSIAKHYNNAFILVETNDIGQQVADILYQDLEYENMLFTVPSPTEGVKLSAGFKGISHPGVRTTRQVKKIGCSNFKSLIENDKLIINDFDTIQEMYRFIHKGSSFEAEEGNDDLVMCSVLFSWLSDQLYFKELTSVDFRKRLALENERRLEDYLLPFGIKDTGDDTMVLEEEPVIKDLENMSFDEWLRN